MSAVRILVADDHIVVRRGLRALIESQAGWELCGEAVDGRQAVEMVKRLQPEVAVVDISMPGLDGLSVTRQIVKEAPKTQVLILSMHDSEDIVREALAAGARGYVLKADAESDLLAAVKALKQSKPFLSSMVSEVVLKGYQDGHSPALAGESALRRLTPREQQVLKLLAEGNSCKQVATALGIGVKPGFPF